MVSSLSKSMEKCLRNRLEQVKQMAFSEIKKMPEYSDEEVSINDKLYTLAVWKKLTKDGMTQIVVQAYHHKFLGIGIMIADGFLVDSHGKFLPLPEETRLEYC